MSIIVSGRASFVGHKLFFLSHEFVLPMIHYIPRTWVAGWVLIAAWNVHITIAYAHTLDSKQKRFTWKAIMVRACQ